MKKQIKNRIYNEVKGCNFYGVKWDAPALEVLATVAKGLTNLTELFKSQHITIESMLTLKGGDTDVPKNQNDTTK